MSVVEQIKQIDFKDFLYTVCCIETKSNNKAICPLCGSGTKKNKTPAFHVYENNYKCFSCGFSGDQIELYKNVFKVDFKEAIESISTLYGYDVKKNGKHNVLIQVGSKYKIVLDDKCKVEGKVCDCNICDGIKNKEYPIYKSVESLKKANGEFNEFDSMFEKQWEYSDQESKVFNSKYNILSRLKESIMDGIGIQREIRNKIEFDRLKRAEKMLNGKDNIKVRFNTQEWYDLATYICEIQ